jgi:hypothetical protein
MISKVNIAFSKSSARARGMAQMVEHMLSKTQTPNSTPKFSKKKKAI